ncbi:MAG: hypothetical protein HC902_03465 [Calothrix sp. SM1_5_4]|nr:hypothetical protein [Calothrix sp. SM1_5_4]
MQVFKPIQQGRGGGKNGFHELSERGKILGAERWCVISRQPPRGMFTELRGSVTVSLG